MQSLTQVRFEQDGPIARLTLNRPESRNALSPTLIDEAVSVLEQVAESDSRVLILAGEGASFSAGVDLKVGTSPDYTREVAKRFGEQARRLGLLLSTIPQATIARVTGHCFTGGMEIALGCDLIVASEDAVFCDTHAKLGFTPHWGVSQRLPRLIGAMRAREMSFTARRVGAREALEMGLVLSVHPADKLDAQIEDLAQAIVANSGGSVAGYKTLYRASENMFLDDGLAYEGASYFKVKDRLARVNQIAGNLGKAPEA